MNQDDVALLGDEAAAREIAHQRLVRRAGSTSASLRSGFALLKNG
jgi:hypothetical protein